MMILNRITWALALAGMLLVSAGCADNSADNANDQGLPVLVWDQQNWDGAVWD